MSTIALTQSDMRSIIVNLSSIELHQCLANESVSRQLEDATVEMLREEAKVRGLL